MHRDEGNTDLTVVSHLVPFFMHLSMQCIGLRVWLLICFPNTQCD